MSHKVYSSIISAIREGRLREPFSKDDFRTACPELGEGTYNAFLDKHSQGNPGKNSELFNRVSPGLFKCIRPLKYGLEMSFVNETVNESASESFVCPQPRVWNTIHKILLDAKKQRAPLIPDPPIPLILAGWWASTDDDKRARWINTVKWAQQYGFLHVIPKLADSDCYFA